MPQKTAASDAEQLSGQVITGQLGCYRVVEGGGWLGGGASANVFLAVNEYTMDRVAIKCIDRFVIEQNGRKRELLVRELNIATKLKHPNIINLMEVVFDEHYVHLIMELAAGGELYGSVKDGAFPESRAQVVFHQIVSALAYCHGNGVCHRDLKLENLVLVEESAGAEFVKVTDFGLSKDSAMHSQPNTKVGTISYMAPEVTMANSSSVHYDGKAADAWSLGVILYVLVCCAYPFGYDGPADMGGEATSHVCARIRKGKFSAPGHLSKECRSLLDRMLDKDPGTRISAKDALQHPWLAGVQGAAHKLSSAASAAAAAGFDAVAWPVPKGAAGGTLWFTPAKSGGGSAGGGRKGLANAADSLGTLPSQASSSWEDSVDDGINDPSDSDGLAESGESGGVTAEPGNDIGTEYEESGISEGVPPVRYGAAASIPEPEPMQPDMMDRGRRRRRNSCEHDEDGLAALQATAAAYDSYRTSESEAAVVPLALAPAPTSISTPVSPSGEPEHQPRGDSVNAIAIDASANIALVTAQYSGDLT